MSEKKLVRTQDDRMIAGVCGGLAQYFGIDVTLVRVLFVLFALLVGGGFWVYLILWVVMPEDNAGGDDVAPKNMTEES